MKNPFNSTPSRLNPKQAVAIAAIVISGIAAGAWILGTGPATPVSETAEPAAHAEAEGHDDKEHHGSRAGDGHADTGGHGDAEHHVGKTETEGEAHDETIVLTDAQIQSAGIGID